MATTTADEKGKDYGDYEEYNDHPRKYGDKYDGACLPKWLENRDYDKYKFGKDWKNDNLNGTNKDDYLNGRGGDDTIYGKGGNDALIGGKGNDKVRLPEAISPGDAANAFARSRVIGLLYRRHISLQAIQSGYAKNPSA